MTTTKSYNRYGSRMYDVPVNKKSAKATEQYSRTLYYERLMQVSIYHSFYNNYDDRCPTFICYPTSATASLMKSLGLLFKNEEIGFSILYDVNRKDDLLDYLRLQRNTAGECKPPRKEVWTRLSFVMASRNAFFTNITRIPIDTNPLAQNFYFTNREAHESDGEVLLTPGDRVTAEELLPLIPSQIAVSMKERGRPVEQVRAVAVSGEIVICKPRCVSEEAAKLKDPSSFTCEDEGDYVCTETVYLDFATFPEDKYTIEKINQRGRVVASEQVLYTTSSHQPQFGLIDLLLTDPQEKGKGVYPIADLCPKTKTTITAITYDLRFETRETYWNYYIVPQSQSEGYEFLAIKPNTIMGSIEPSRERWFAGPCCVKLSNGSLAYRFTSLQPLPLLQQSYISFKLVGKSSMMPQVATLVSRLPVAPVQQVSPETYDQTCLGIRDSVCPDIDISLKCQELIDFLCGQPVNPDGGSYPDRRNYSDIYVYV